DDQLFHLMLGEFPVNFADDSSGFVIEPPHSPFNNYTTQEFGAIRSNALKINNETQLSTLLRFHVEQHKLKRLEFHDAIKNEYEREIKSKHDELKLLRLCGFDTKDKNINGLFFEEDDDDELIKKEGKMVKDGN
ncbi:9253_t:CDS:2, partial [Racocetra persica]